MARFRIFPLENVELIINILKKYDKEDKVSPFLHLLFQKHYSQIKEHIERERRKLLSGMATVN